MTNKPGSIIGGILLITGSTVGAGMLGLPILTGLSGFFPGLLMFLCAWLFMTATGLLVVEASGKCPPHANLSTIVEHSLGKTGRVICWVNYLFLFYALLVAYISGSGNLLSTFLNDLFHIKFPIWAGSLFFVLLFANVVFLGTRKVDLWNRSLMLFKIVFFVLLIFVGVRYIEPHLLTRTNPSFMFFSLPILAISFGYHNMIPTLTAYMKGDRKRVRLAIIGGTIFTLMIYLIWEVLVLGVVPLEGENGIINSLRLDREASQSLTAIIGSPWISTFAQGLAFFAILTSFLAQSLSLVHFLSDALKVRYQKKEHPSMLALALIPPLILALVYPQLFFKALNFAGGICTMILFGIMPVLQVWITRNRSKEMSPYAVAGGKGVLGIIMAVSLFILFFQLYMMLGPSYIPKT